MTSQCKWPIIQWIKQLISSVFICRIVIYVVYSALQDLNNQSQMFRKPSIKKIKQGGLGSSGKGRVPLLPSPVSSHLLLLILLLLLLFFCFFPGRGGGLGVSLLYVLNLPALHYLNAQKKKLSVNIYCKLPVPILM